MKRSVLSLAVSGLLLALPLSLAAMDNKDVVKMHKAGLSEDTIIAAMQKEKPDYDTGIDALIELKTAGVSEKVIQMMIKLQTPPAAAAPAPAPAPTTPPAPAPTTTPAPAPAPGPAPAPDAPAPATSGTPGPMPSMFPATAPGAGGPTPGPMPGGAFWGDFPSIAPPKIEASVGKDYFTRYSFHEEKNEHSTTNYSRGGLVPINTPVKLISMAGKKLTLKRLDTGQEIKVENEEKYTKRSINQIANEMLAEEKTALEKLPDEVAAAIRNGEMRKGMTKELVIMARGYPPAHETASVESDRWVYWTSRFVKLTVVFINGRLSEGRGLY